MRLTKSLAVAVSALALSTSAAFAGEGPLTDQSDPMDQQESYEQYAMPEYEVYDVYLVPAEEIVLIPLEQPSEVPISGDELG